MIIRPLGADDMAYDPGKHHRRSIRLQGYDYRQAGAYFVTVCVRGRHCLFEAIVDESVRLNLLGQTVKQCWRETPSHFPQVILDKFIIMPNHVHGILIIAPRDGDAPRGARNGSQSGGQSRSCAGANDHSPLRRPAGTSSTIGSIIRGFKGGVVKRSRESCDICAIWQRGYYEHIIRNDTALDRIRRYIEANPTQWAQDPENPSITDPHVS
jgi:REP element-mobilizing transposase RayT